MEMEHIVKVTNPVKKAVYCGNVTFMRMRESKKCFYCHTREQGNVLRLVRWK